MEHLGLHITEQFFGHPASVCHTLTFIVSMWFFAQHEREKILQGNALFCAGLIPYAYMNDAMVALLAASLILGYCSYRLFLRHRIRLYWAYQDATLLSLVCCVGAILLYQNIFDILAVLAFVLGRGGECLTRAHMTRLLYLTGALLWLVYGVAHGIWANVFAQFIFASTVWLAMIRYQDLNLWRSYWIARPVSTSVPQSISNEK